MKHTITLIPGDGIGPEVTEAVVRILNASGVQIEWEPQLAGVLALDLFANLRPVWNLPGVDSRFQGVDLVVVRENTEDLYAGLEHQVVDGVVESLKIITERASTRIAQFAFSHARRHGRRKVTAIHKANIMKLSDGLFLECSRRTAREYPGVAYDERIVDAACMQLVMFPER